MLESEVGLKSLSEKVVQGFRFPQEIVKDVYRATVHT